MGGWNEREGVSEMKALLKSRCQESLQTGPQASIRNALVLQTPTPSSPSSGLFINAPLAQGLCECVCVVCVWARLGEKSGPISRIDTHKSGRGQRPSFV